MEGKVVPRFLLTQIKPNFSHLLALGSLLQM